MSQRQPGEPQQPVPNQEGKKKKKRKNPPQKNVNIKGLLYVRVSGGELKQTKIKNKKIKKLKKKTVQRECV